MASKICVVIINYKKYTDTIECLESLFRSNGGGFKVVVVDNDSGNDSLRHIADWASGKEPMNFSPAPGLERLFVAPLEKPLKFSSCSDDAPPEKPFVHDGPELLLLQSGKNLGFSGGNNLAMRLALLDPEIGYFWMLNNDTVVEPDTLRELELRAAEYSSLGQKVGIMGCKLFRYSAPRQLQAVGGTYNKWFALTGHVGAFEYDEGQYDRDASGLGIDYVIGASMYVPRAFIDEVGMMAEEYFLYFEEIDWALRGRQKGWGIGFAWKARVFHKEGATIGSSYVRRNTSRLSDYYGIRNRILITRKFYPGCLPLVYLTFAVTLLNRIARLQFDRIGMVLGIIFKT